MDSDPVFSAPFSNLDDLFRKLVSAWMTLRCTSFQKHPCFYLPSLRRYLGTWRNGWYVWGITIDNIRGRELLRSIQCPWDPC